jgi:RNA recognition motif-containing protein
MKNLFVGNLDFHVVEDDLRELFGQYGQIDRITLMRERDTGRSRGFAFVEMANTDDADKAIKELDGGQFVGRTLRVNEARPRAERSQGLDRGGYRRRSA